MSTTNKYENMSAITALKYINNGNLLLPDIQREYVWDIFEIERLFESIVDDYPIGSCIFWKTNKKIINTTKPNLYRFIRKFKKNTTKNEKIPEVLSEETDYYIVLDGQQRITSMNIALYGDYTLYKGGKGHACDNPKSWITKELYYNLNFYSYIDEDEEHPKKRFVFLTVEEAKNGNFFKVKEILKYEQLQDFLIVLLSIQNINKEVIADLSTLYQRLFDSSSNGLIHYYCISENTYDEALDIFVRVNSTGRKLSKSDLLFSTLIDGWKTGKENIENILDIMNNKGDGFRFTRDYLMRLCLVLVDADTNLKINSLTHETIRKIRDNWETISKTLDEMTTMLADIGICNENLSSYNATMPLAYYYFKGGKIKDAVSRKEVKKFLSVSLAKRLFGIASNDALNSSRNTLKTIDCKNKKFTLKFFENIVLTGGRTFKVEESDIDYWIDTYEKGQSTYILLSLLYPNLKLSQITFHQDHCHPFISFNTKNLLAIGVNSNCISLWQKKCNRLPNLQFLEGRENESKNKTPLIDWVAAGNTFEYCPKNVSLELKDFEEFYEERRKILKSELKKVFEVF